MHKHRANPRLSQIRGYRGTVNGVIHEVRRAHGGILTIDQCSCGAVRETNSNGLAVERGRWLEAESE
jgi:hypothetical protein